MLLKLPAFDVTFDGSQISGSDVTLQQGDLIELHGLSGAGCETFLLLLGGLIPSLTRTEPSAKGKIVRPTIRIAPEDLPPVRFDDSPLHGMDEVDRASTVGIVFGEPELFILGETVWEEFRYGFSAVNRNAPRINALERYGLYGKQNLRTETLSCGEQHRLNWACFLELRPPVVLADLSSANLDSEFLDHLRSWLIGRRGSQIAVVHGVPRGHFGNAATQWHFNDGILHQGPPDDDDIPHRNAARDLLTEEFRARQTRDPVKLQVAELCRDEVTGPVSFNLHEREVLRISGPNGVGKTTLGKILTGQIRRVEVNGGTIPLVRSMKAAMSFQYPGRAFLAPNLRLELSDPQVVDICEFSDTELAAEPRSLPFSRQKLAASAIALSIAEDFAVLDEPTAGMDFHDKLRLVRLLNHRNELSSIIISHDLEIEAIGRSITWDEIRV